MYEVIVSRDSDGLGAGRSRLDSRQEYGIFLLTTAFRQALGPPNGNRGAVIPGVRRPGSEAGHSPPCSAKVKSGREITPLPTHHHDAVLN
jgi:hypothetical protein